MATGEPFTLRSRYSLYVEIPFTLRCKCPHHSAVVHYATLRSLRYAAATLLRYATLC